ncbi:GlsB/YeaQ/YmgE family stress response membrane protein [Cupriavidus sp. WKF15]|uniref:GlsB/YeaQ/YmgE family stress response membrane protein n=1 Tax=Cupriavidus sp. WKF15 TaxID=3032282 RepID=UPI0023E193C5|nr:GlsB/YeaQ/YmgE family stress response membrane protein [Cupriavidus sp. WKF15]WER50273.1 GlsB/YeaQ/YmgE family stress response membrane protein [Cupriavidus sp. WKF15]
MATKESLIVLLVIGGIAGWLAGVLMKGRGLGLLMDIVLGVAGAFLAHWLAVKLGIHISKGWIGSLITATVGAVLILVVARGITRR